MTWIFVKNDLNEDFEGRLRFINLTYSQEIVESLSESRFFKVYQKQDCYERKWEFFI